MKFCLSLAAATAFTSISPAAGASSGPVFYGDPPDDHHPWAIHDANRPQPKVVTPGDFSSQSQPGKPPSDAIVLFGGNDLSKWQSAKDEGGPAKWRDEGGVLTTEPKTGDIRTKEEFGDCQLHLEWSEPTDVSGSSQGRGNSGAFLMGLVEIQVLDSYNNATYADGGAGSVYGQHPAMANAIRPPGQWQMYDIIFRRPVYQHGEVVDPGYVTVFVNGVVTQDHAVLEGPTGHMHRTKADPFPEKGTLRLQDHGNPVRFRNIWYRPLPPRPSEGGTDGWLSTEATMKKRKEIAAALREEADRPLKAGHADLVPVLLKRAEALVYYKEPPDVGLVSGLAKDYVGAIKLLSPERLAPKKDEVKQVHHAFDYLVVHGVLPADFAPKAALEQIIKEQKWDKK